MPKTAAKKTGEAKSKKGASPYNEFMKTELAKLKKADPKLTHKYAPSVVTPLAFGAWPRSLENKIPRRREPGTPGPGSPGPGTPGPRAALGLGRRVPGTRFADAWDCVAHERALSAAAQTADM